MALTSLIFVMMQSL